MTPVWCRVIHNPPESYGDCLRACIASVMNMSNVPHFADGGADSPTIKSRITKWMAQYGKVPFYLICDPNASVDDVFAFMNDLNPDVHYLLFHRNSGCEHVVVCRGNKIVHDPSLVRFPILGPNSEAGWTIMVISVL